MLGLFPLIAQSWHSTNTNCKFLLARWHRPHLTLLQPFSGHDSHYWSTQGIRFIQSYRRRCESHVDSVCIPAAPTDRLCMWWRRHPGTEGQNCKVLPRWQWIQNVAVLKWLFFTFSKSGNCNVGLTDSCYFFRDDACPQQASGAATLRAKELKRSFSNLTMIHIPSIPLSAGWSHICRHQAVFCVNVDLFFLW